LLHLTLSSLILGLMLVAALPAFAASAASGDFRDAVEVDGRKIHLECKGAGGPTVILISGYRNNAEIWTVERAQGSRTSPAFAPTIARVRSSTPTI
jgi:pimeloyl-ACP methyl ester carboxylesterase